MDPQRHAEVKQVFREAIRWAPEDRAAVVAALAEDAAVRDEAQSLLAHHREPPSAPPAPRAAGDAARGQTLAELLGAGRAGGAAAGWPPERAIRTLEPIAGALADLADRGGVHGAVRADHVAVSEVGGEPAAALAGPPLGDDAPPRLERATAAAAAPEQLLPALGPIGPWTDVYALALLCVELMLGRPATDGSPSAALVRARDEAARPTPRAVGLDVPDAVEAVLARALAIRPMERYQDVRRFWAALCESVAQGRPAPPPPSPRLPSNAIRPAARRPRAWAALAAAIAIAAAIAAAIIAVQRCA